MSLFTLFAMFVVAVTGQLAVPSSGAGATSSPCQCDTIEVSFSGSVANWDPLSQSGNFYANMAGTYTKTNLQTPNGDLVYQGPSADGFQFYLYNWGTSWLFNSGYDQNVAWMYSPGTEANTCPMSLTQWQCLNNGWELCPQAEISICGGTSGRKLLFGGPGECEC